jgi:hypothetical protein
MRGNGCVLAALLALACPAPPAAPETPAPPALPSPPSAPPPLGTEARTEVRAPIVRVAARIAESFPPQVFADVTSALPNGCTRYARSELRREGETIFMDVFNSEPSRDDVACTMLYGEQETAHALGSEFVPGTTYTLDVNGARESFVAP